MADELNNNQSVNTLNGFQSAEAATAPTPTLTLDPFAAAVQEAPAPAPAPAAQSASQAVSEAIIDDSVLSDAEKKMVDEFSKQIDISDTNLVLQYGAGAQQKMASFSESALQNVRTKDLGEVGKLLTSVVTELKSLDVTEEKKGFFGFGKKGKDKTTGLRAKYNSAEKNIDQIVQSLEAHQVQLIKDSAMMDKMYAENLAYFKELSMYIIAGKKKLQEARSTKLVELMDKAKASGLPEDAQAARDYDSLCNRFEKKIHDLELTRVISIQTAPQIRLVQQNDTEMVEKIQSTLVNTIPLWKNQMVIALGVEHATEAAKAQQQVTNLTNALLQSNAQQLHTATVMTAQESERGIVDIETLRKTNESLISTLDDVIRIQEEGRQKRAEAEAEINRLEGELKAKLLEIRTE